MPSKKMCLIPLSNFTFVNILIFFYRDYRREKDAWAKEMERKTGEVTSIKDENQV